MALDNLPPAYIEIFKKAGITKKDLQNADTAKDIFIVIANFNGDV
jgi:hypothetical protein